VLNDQKRRFLARAVVDPKWSLELHAAAAAVGAPAPPGGASGSAAGFCRVDSRYTDWTARRGLRAQLHGPGPPGAVTRP
jgi:hypothetical protein